LQRRRTAAVSAAARAGSAAPAVDKEVISCGSLFFIT
jgi:hypothetical protein